MCIRSISCCDHDLNIRSTLCSKEALKLTLLVIGLLTAGAGFYLYYAQINLLAAQILIGSGLALACLAVSSVFINIQGCCRFEW